MKTFHGHFGGSRKKIVTRARHTWQSRHEDAVEHGLIDDPSADHEQPVLETVARDKRDGTGRTRPLRVAGHDGHRAAAGEGVIGMLGHKPNTGCFSISPENNPN